MTRTAAAIAALFLATPAAAHEWYDPRCCDERDCAPLPDGALREADGGWYVTAPDGTVHHVPYGQQHPMLPPDGQPHACFSPYDGRFMTRTFGTRRVMCLHVPGGAS